MAETEAHNHSQQISQWSPHEHRQSPNTVVNERRKGPVQGVALGEAQITIVANQEQRAMHHQRQLEDGGQEVKVASNPKASQGSAAVAPKRPAANAEKSSKRGSRTEVQKARRRQADAKKRVDQAKAAGPVEVAEDNVASRRRKTDEDASLLGSGLEPRKATITPIIPGKIGRKRSGEPRAEQRNQPEGFQSPMIQ